MGVRVFILAKELGMASKDLIAYLRTQGHSVKSHMSNVENAVAEILRDRLKPKTPPKAVEDNGNAATAQTGTEKKDEAEVADAPATKTAEPRTPPEPRRSSDASGERVRGGRFETKPRSDRDVQPKRRRYFPSRDDIYDRAPFGGRRSRTRRGGSNRGGGGTSEAAPSVTRPKSIEVTLPVTVKELSALSTLKAQEIITTLMQEGQLVTITESLNEDQVTLVCLAYDIEVEFKKKADDTDDEVRRLEDRYKPKSDDDLTPRAPVVTFLGHVDHGKTSLLDKIRRTKVVDKESGGITQHIGAYRVDSGDTHVVFIDTPGHSAFTEMRARGANVTDIAVLVVAADDGVKPQTEEAYSHAKDADVQIVVALNKMDRPNANPMKCKQDLANMGLLPSEWNGDTEVVEVSAITGEGIDALLETLSLTAQLLELKADPSLAALGVVLEAAATTSRGVVATVLIQNGTLRKGDDVVCGSAFGRVRNMLLNGTQQIESAGPATPVQITGLRTVPRPGDKLYAVDESDTAKRIAQDRSERQRVRERVKRQQITRETLFPPLSGEKSQDDVKIILKGDVRGSVEAIRAALEDLSTDEIKVVLIHSGVGAITQDDVSLADASGAMIVGFNVGLDDRARSLAEERRVVVRTYSVIYQAIDDVRAAMEKQLAPETEEQFHGRIEIRQVFRASKIGNIAGCMVTSGHVLRGDRVRLLRDGKVIYAGVLSSLRRFKEDVREVREGFECGLRIANYDDIKEGDVVEAFEIIERPATL